MTCSNQVEQTGSAAAREGCRTLPCAVNLYPSMDIGWRTAQRLKNEAYEAYRRRYAVAFREKQLDVNPLLKTWIT